MRKTLGIIAAILVTAIVLSGCTGRKAAPAVGNTTDSQPPVPAQSAGTVSLPGNQFSLNAALQQASAVRYEIVTAADTAGLDKDAYLDKILADKQWPEGGMMVLVVYPNENYDIRFALGPAFFEKKVTVSEMLDLVRANYLTKARKEDPAGGLADLIQAVNQRMSR